MANKVLSLEELGREWPARSALAELVDFDVDDVPPSLRILAPYAETWGIADDSLRERIFAQTPPALVAHLRDVISVFDDELDEWLAGPEATSETPTDAYVAFSAMRMGVDLS